MKTSESISKIAGALLKAQSSMGNATKGASNPYFKSSYADLNSIREVVTPALNSNGITLLQPTTVIDGGSYVETILLHESGEFLSGLTPIVVSKANDPQAAGSAISYARRYGLQSFLSVGAVDDDAEKAMSRSSYSKPAVTSVEELKVASTSGAQSSSTSPENSNLSKAPSKKSLFKKPAQATEAKPNGSNASSNEDAWN